MYLLYNIIMRGKLLKVVFTIPGECSAKIDLGLIMDMLVRQIKQDILNSQSSICLARDITLRD